VLESLPLCRLRGAPARLTRCLEGLATILTTGTEPWRAARLLSAAAAFCRALQAMLPPDERVSLRQRAYVRSGSGSARPRFGRPGRPARRCPLAAALEEATVAALAP